MAQLQQLTQMKASGVLSDAEFAAAKAKLLGS
jgi:Short C-terminal domain